MRITALITNAADVKRILGHIGEASEPPPVSPSRAPPEEEFEFGPQDHADVEFEFNQDPPRDEEIDFDRCVERGDDTVV